MDKTLVMMVGLPRSGKTTRAREISLHRNAPIVSPDSIRLALHGQPFVRQAEPYVWAIARTMVEALFGAHDTVILDACNVTLERREPWRNPKAWKREFVPIYVSSELCIRRAGDNAALVEAIKRMAEHFTSVRDDEHI